MTEQTHPRAFKTAWFGKAARKAQVSDAMLCKAITQVIAGQADDLGGGVFKKRLANNQYRSIILARGREFWVYQYMFAKQDRANIDNDELKGFRQLARTYATMTRQQMDAQVIDGHWIEICRKELDQAS
jgi:hypothetical protein